MSPQGKNRIWLPQQVSGKPIFFVDYIEVLPIRPNPQNSVVLYACINKIYTLPAKIIIAEIVGFSKFYGLVGLLMYITELFCLGCLFLQLYVGNVRYAAASRQ